MGNLKYSDKTPIKEGDYFIALMSDDYDTSQIKVGY